MRRRPDVRRDVTFVRPLWGRQPYSHSIVAGGFPLMS